MILRRFGLGPVFAFEWLLASRRWQMYAVRSLVVAVLLAAIALVTVSTVPGGFQVTSLRDHARVGAALFHGFFATLLTVVLFAAPAATAGSICVDKARGTLLHVMVTDLSNVEIAFGKLAVRLTPVFGLIAASAPVLTMCTLLGGIDPEAVLRAYTITAAAAFFGCALTLLLSVWGRKTHEVLLAAYLAEIALLLALPISMMIERALKKPLFSMRMGWTNPYYLALTEPPPGDLRDFLLFTIGVGFLCALLAAVFVRRAAIRSGAVPQRKRSAVSKRRPLVHWPFGPRLDPNPVLWREWHRQRPTKWTRLVWLVYVVGSLAATVCLIVLQVNRTPEPGLVAFTTGLQVSVGLLLASVAAVTALAEERVRGSLDVLLTTPLTTRAIVWGKWRGAFRRIPLLAILPMVNIAISLYSLDRVFSIPLLLAAVLAYGAWVTSMGLAIAAWVGRLGRAIAVSVAFYVLVTAGWLALTSLICDHRTFESVGLASPFFGAGQLAFETAQQYERETRCYVPLTLWIMFYSVVALLLYAATLRTFDRCLGRSTVRRASERGMGN